MKNEERIYLESDQQTQEHSQFGFKRLLISLLCLAVVFFAGTKFGTRNMVSQSDVKKQIATAELESYQKGFEAGEFSGYKTGYSAGKGTASASYDTYRSKRVEDVRNSYTVYVTRTGEKYHSAGCSYLSQSCYEISYSDAIDQGYTACSRCDP